MQYVLLLAFLITSCATILPQQQDLAVRVHRATVACTALPATTGCPPATNARKAKVCAQALLCQSTAKSAAEALQAANAARAGGSTDVAAEARSAGLDVLARTACKQGGW